MRYSRQKSVLDGPKSWQKSELIEKQDRKMLRRDTQTSLLGTVFLLAFTQVTLAVILVIQQFNMNMRPVSANIVIARFICGLIFHIYLQAEFA